MTLLDDLRRVIATDSSVLASGRVLGVTEGWARVKTRRGIIRASVGSQAVALGDTVQIQHNQVLGVVKRRADVKVYYV